MTAVRLVPAKERAPEPTPDAHQRAVLDALAAGHRTVVVTGAPGTGKTTLAVAAAVSAHAAGVEADRILALAPTRSAAALLRDRISHALGAPTSAPVARTPAALAFSILSGRAAMLNEPAPSLISGAEQDVVLRELLEGHRGGVGGELDWGPSLPVEATALPGFRDELRNLLMRAAEADLAPHALARLGDEADRPEWRAAALLYAEYEAVMALRSTPADQGERFDPATVIARAADALSRWDEEPGGAAPRWDLVIVDDHQDSTAATVALLGELVRGGSRLLLVGNADQSVQGYRGAVPGAVAAAAAAPGALHIELAIDHRQGPALARVTAAVASRIGVKGVGSARGAYRAALGRDLQGEPSPVTALVAAHRTGQSRAIAAQLRRARHGLDGAQVAWKHMVVIARSRAELRRVRADLIAADIPCEALGEATALHREGAVATLLSIVRVAGGQAWTEESALAVLGSRLIGVDSVALRRLRRALVREERQGGGQRTSAELLLEAVSAPEFAVTIPGVEGQACVRLAKAVAAAAARIADDAAPGAVLWAAWEAVGVAEQWREAALAGSARDDADLDAVIAVMRAAQTFSERLPRAGVGAFLDHLESQEFAADSLGARGIAADAVRFATPAGAAGLEYQLVVIAGLEEGVWPNLALRDSVLGAQRLADALADGMPGAAERAKGVADARAARAAVLDDETRALLVAVSRATARIVVTAVDDGQTRPSRFMTLLEQSAGVTRAPAASMRTVADLRDAVAFLRSSAHTALETDPDQAIGAATMLARLARLGVAGADPLEWHGAGLPSTGRPLWEEGARVRVSPSKVEAVETCTLRWALESVGGTADASEAQEIGSLLHQLAQEHPRGGQPLIEAFEQRWSVEHRMSTWPERKAYERTKAKADRLASYLRSRPDVEVLVEQPFEVERGRAVLSGIADRIEISPEGALVADLKTGESIPSIAEAEANAQLAMYQLAVVEGAVPGARTALGAELVYVSQGKEGTRRTQSPIDPEPTRERFDAVVDLMTASSFMATVNPRCDACAVRSACPALAQGRQVSQS